VFYFDFGNYFKMVRLAWNERAPKARAYYLAVLLIAVPIVSSFHAICFALDRLFVPGLVNVEVKDPIFMVGHARSGTTLTHRLMTEDAGRFSFFRLWECYFPSLLQKKIIRAGIELDERVLGGFLARRMAKFEEWRYGKGRHIHEMGLAVPEEDDIALYYSMASGFWITKMPYMEDLDFYRMNDWPESKRSHYNNFYRELVKRQLYLNGPEKTHLAKNPLWAGRVASLIEAFPDAKFVVNMRDPRETIPSLLKLLSTGWKALGWDPERQKRCLEVMVETSFDSYTHPLEVLDANPQARSAVVDYRELTTDSAAAIERLYRDLGLPLTDAYRTFLARQGKREKKHSTRHRYSLEEFGLEHDAIRASLGPLFDRFQWETDPDAEAAPASPEGGA
jgi:hypothetical protein